MRRAATYVAVIVSVMAISEIIGVTEGAQRKQPSVSSAWVRLPAAGATSTEAYATLENPTMYDFYLQQASSDVAGSVELRQAGNDKALENVTVPAFGSLEMDPKGVHMLLKELKKRLAEGDKVDLTVVTEAGAKLEVEAVVRKE